jgi:hypothetical protein
MLILTPIAHNEQPHPDCQRAVELQTIACNRVFQRGVPNNDKRWDMAVNAEQLREYAIHSNERYVVQMDSDVYLPQNDIMKKMYNEIKKTNLPALAVDTKGLDNKRLEKRVLRLHTIIALIIMPIETLLHLTWTDIRLKHAVKERYDCRYVKKNYIAPLFVPDGCYCEYLNARIKQLYGVRIPYIKNVKASEIPTVKTDA